MRFTAREYKHLLIVMILGFVSGLPFALLTSTLQAWMSDLGSSVASIGWLSLLGLPYTFRMFLAPIVDRWSLTFLGRRRSWLLLTQGLLISGFWLLPWIRCLNSSLILFIFLLVLALCSALQDMVVDAQRIEYLEPQDYGLGASLAVLGYRFALLMGSGIALMLASSLGWDRMYRTLSLLLLLGPLVVLWSHEPEHLASNLSFTSSYRESIFELLRRPYFFTMAGLIIFYKLGEAFTTTSSGLMMPFLRQGLGFSLNEIGSINHLVGVLAMIAGGVGAGLLLRRCSLWPLLIGVGLGQAFSNALFWLLAQNGPQFSLFVISVFMDNLMAGMGSTILVAWMMGQVNQQYTATQFSILVALSTLPRLVIGPLGAFVQAYLGWPGFFACGFALSFLFLPWAFVLKKDGVSA